MEAIVFIILQMFFATRAVLKIGEYPRIFPSFSWGIFAHVTRLDQSRASENIWWIIINNYSTSTGWIWGDRYSQRGAKRRVGYNHLISNKREWNNCFIKNNQQILVDFADFAWLEQPEGNAI